MASLTNLSARALSELIATRDVSCLEVMQAGQDHALLTLAASMEPILGA